ncbi:eukaryotic translation initiation factor 4B-like [Pyrus ussuriensis x Pyrus communis]|uniref:Eukaryotic translation initiation factor 4B-like n=1 Tax=Pyrus ussuriensis x Pyrus communis TaxID=2448454 RepID=A0A5N5FXQ1_9ROSA|nr:eukaryotic translation initiation factor 4B-like [Pyrus ussuriensis x Pyrus communis]
MLTLGSECFLQPSPAPGRSPLRNKKPNSNKKPMTPPFVEFPTLCNCRHRAQEEDTNHLRRFKHCRRAQAQPRGAAHMPYESEWEGTNRDGIAKKSMEGNGFESWVFRYVLSEDEDLAATVLGLLIGIRYGNAGD